LERRGGAVPATNCWAAAGKRRRNTGGRKVVEIQRLMGRGITRSNVFACTTRGR